MLKVLSLSSLLLVSARALCFSHTAFFASCTVNESAEEKGRYLVETTIESSLNEVGRPRFVVPQGQLDSWEKVASRANPTSLSDESACIWLGEAYLGKKEPVLAQEWFDRAIELAMPRSNALGLATYNRCIALFYQGRYSQASEAFSSILASDLPGFDRRNAVRFLKHAESAAGYHAVRKEAGITEPTHLDPLCGASGFAIVLRHLGRDYRQEAVVKEVPHTGEGSTAKDLVTAAERFGLKAVPLQLDRTSLPLVLKASGGIPLITRVERDHFIAVTKATSEGVTYECSDCGPWPGGVRKVTWQQWALMEADMYMAVAVPGSRFSRDLASLPVLDERDTEAVANPSDLGNAAIIPPEFLEWIFCGMKPEALQCMECPEGREICPIEDSTAGGFAGGPSAGGPVNLATGEEQYSPSPDLSIYNPVGPGVTWKRIYNSLGNFSSGFGHGWSHPYNVGIEIDKVRDKGSDKGDYIRSMHFISENGARVALLAENGGLGHAMPSAINPVIALPIKSGFPYRATWHFQAGTDFGFVRIQWKDRSVWQFDTTAYDHVPGIDQGGNSGFPIALHPFRVKSYYQPIARMTNALGRFITFTHDTFSTDGFGKEPRLTEIRDDLSALLLTVNNDSEGKILSVTDRYSRTVNYTHVKEFTTGSPPTSHQYYWLLHTVSTINSAIPRWTYSYQAFGNGNGAETVPYLATISVPSATGIGTAQTIFTYYGDGRIWKTWDANQNSKEFIYGLNTTKAVTRNAANVVVHEKNVEFNANMNLTRVWLGVPGVDQALFPAIDLSYASPVTAYRPTTVKTYPRDPFTFGAEVTTTLTWDQNNNLVSIRTPKHASGSADVEYVWDYITFPMGRLMEVVNLSKTSSLFDYFEPSGLLKEVHTPKPGEVGTGNRQVTSYTYDALGNLLTSTRPGNNATATRTVTYNYTTDGAYSQPAAIGQPLTMTNELGKVWHFRYDARGNTTQAWDPVGITHDATYNLADQPVEQLAPATGTSGAGRATSITTYLYLGGPVTKTEFRGEAGSIIRTVLYALGKEGEVLSVTGDTEPVTIAYTGNYDPAVVTDGNGNQTIYSYDTRGWLKQVDYPLASGATFDRLQYTLYSPSGNLLSSIDGKGTKWSYDYGDGFGLGDPNGLLWKVTAQNTLNQVLETTTLTYDAYDRVNLQTDAQGTESFTYDDLDLALSKTRTYTGLPAKTFTYEYYLDGSRKKLVTPSGQFVTTYDAAGRYASLSSPAGLSSANFYDNNRQSFRGLPTGSETLYSYNPVGQFAQVCTSFAGFSQVDDHSGFGYDGTFNTTAATHTLSLLPGLSGTTSFSYDSKDRLTQESSPRLTPSTRNFSFDGAFNLTGWKTALPAQVNQTFNADNQRTGGLGFVYDGNGNPTTYDGSALTFDHNDQLVQVGNWSAGYKPGGLRAYKQTTTASTSRRYFLYDGLDPVLELDSNGNTIAINVFAPDGLVARQEGSVWTYYTFDTQGSVVRRLNASDQPTSTSFYDAFGLETNSGSPSDPFGYNARWGYYFDRELGLYRCGVRYYDPSRGRWLTRDPIGYAGGINLYGYCGGNPVGWADPNGAVPLPLLLVAAAMILGTDIALAPSSPSETTPEAIQGYRHNLANQKCSLILDLFDFADGPTPGPFRGIKEVFERSVKKASEKAAKGAKAATKEPDNLRFGKEMHKKMEADYKSKHRNAKTEHTLDNGQRVDIWDEEIQTIFEIGPAGSEKRKRKQMAGYLEEVQKEFPGAKIEHWPYTRDGKFKSKP